MRLTDFDLVKSKISEIQEKYNLPQDCGTAMDFFVCETFLNLDHDSSEEFITDSSFISNTSANDDRGIDILYYNKDADEDELEVTIINCKFKSEFGKASSYVFPNNELIKLESALTDLTEAPDERRKGFNIKQQPAIDEISTRYKNGEKVSFKVYFCSNCNSNVDQSRFKILKEKFGEVSFNVFGLDDIINKHRDRSKPKIDGKITLQKENMFKLDSGFVARINAADILRLFSDNSELRNKTEFDLCDIKKSFLDENVLHDNVRKFKGVKNTINSRIIDTALDENNCYKFFYYNNGLTILCNKIKVPPNVNRVTITLEGMQVFNGGQTLRCLNELKKEEQIANLETIEVLCRFYDIKNDLDFSSKIAEYTNSQTAVNNRDIKAIDEKQRRLQEILKEKGYLYQLKVKEFDKEKSKDRIIDLEKIAQCLYAFDLDSPAQARNNKKDVFSTKYDTIFTDELKADHIIGLFELLKLITIEKNNKIKKDVADEVYNKPEYSFVVNSDFFMLYGMKKLYIKFNKELPADNELTALISLYDDVYDIIQNCVREEMKRKSSDTKNAAYSNSTYFKNKRLKEDIDLAIQNYVKK